LQVEEVLTTSVHDPFFERRAYNDAVICRRRATQHIGVMTISHGTGVGGSWTASVVTAGASRVFPRQNAASAICPQRSWN
jgi:hypothetical protein